MVIGLSGGMTHLVQNMHRNKPNLFLYIKTFFCYLVFLDLQMNPPPPSGIFADMYHFTQGYLKNVCLHLIGWWGWLCSNILYTLKVIQSSF